VEDSLRERARTARADVRRGALRGVALLEWLRTIPFRDRDEWVDELLGFEALPPDIPDLPRGAVPYVPCSVEEIMAMVQDVPVLPGDEVVDLGSGLGRVVILAHLLAGARARGVEIQEPLVRRARERAAELGLTDVSFEHANAVDATLDGSIFFLHAPFNGEMLKSVLSNLESVARRRAIVLCAVGLEFRDLPWLQPRSSRSVALAIYDSRVAGVPHRVAGARS
jgi:SAM-dependent methyltransferase